MVDEVAHPVLTALEVLEQGQSGGFGQCVEERGLGPAVLDPDALTYHRHVAMIALNSDVARGQRLLYGQRVLTIAERLDALNRLGRALADPTRARILVSLLERPGHPAELADELDLTRTNVSNHLSCLRGCGIVVATPEGRRTRYEIADPHLSRALESLLGVVLAVEDGVVCTDEDCDLPLCCGTTTQVATRG